MSVNVNTASAQELRQAFARIGDIVTHLILDFRQKYGVVKREAVNLALWGNLPTQILDLMDFSEPYDDPFDLNLLPPVPKANSREPLMSSSKTQRSPVFKEPEVASTQGHSAWLSKASQELDQELSEMLAATSLRSYRTGLESSTAKDVKVTHSSRSDQRSRSNSPNSEDDILVKIERPFARLSEDTGAKKQEPCSYRTGFMSNIDKKENHATSGMSSSKQQTLNSYAKKGGAGKVSDRIKSEPGLHAAEPSERMLRLSRSVRRKSRSTSRSSASRSRSDSSSRSNKHLSRKTGAYDVKKSHKKSHKHSRHQSRSRSSSMSTSRSSSRSLHRPTMRGHATKHSKSNRHRRHSSSGSRSKSRSPSRSRSHRTKRSKVHKRKPKRSSSSRSSSKSRLEGLLALQSSTFGISYQHQG